MRNLLAKFQTLSRIERDSFESIVTVLGIAGFFVIALGGLN